MSAAERHNTPRSLRATHVPSSGRPSRLDDEHPVSLPREGPRGFRSASQTCWTYGRGSTGTGAPHAQTVFRRGLVVRRGFGPEPLRSIVARPCCVVRSDTPVSVRRASRKPREARAATAIQTACSDLRVADASSAIEPVQRPAQQWFITACCVNVRRGPLRASRLITDRPPVQQGSPGSHGGASSPRRGRGPGRCRPHPRIAHAPAREGRRAARARGEDRTPRADEPRSDRSSSSCAGTTAPLREPTGHASLSTRAGTQGGTQRGRVDHPTRGSVYPPRGSTREHVATAGTSPARARRPTGTGLAWIVVAIWCLVVAKSAQRWKVLNLVITITMRCDFPGCKQHLTGNIAAPSDPHSASALRVRSGQLGWISALRTAREGDHTRRVRQEYCPEHGAQYEALRAGRPRL